MILDLLLVFLAAAGVILVLWCILGLMLLPVFGHSMLTLCYVKGDADGLEQKTKAYGWLRDGRISGGRMVIVDCGLSELGMGRTHLLQERYPWVEYCPLESLPSYITSFETCTDPRAPS